MPVTSQLGPFNYTPRPDYIKADFQEFTATGTWKKPNGVTFVLVETWGGGGGGGSGTNGTTSQYITGGAGGGGGAYNFGIFKASDLSSTVSVTIGSGGNGNGSGLSGATGGTSSFGTLIKAYGGGGGSAGTLTSSTYTYGLGGTGGGIIGQTAPDASVGNTSPISGHFGGSSYYSGMDSGWGGGGGSGATAIGSLTGANTAGDSASGGSGGGMGIALGLGLVSSGYTSGGSISGQNTSNAATVGCNGLVGTQDRNGGNGGGAGANATIACGSGIAAGGTRLVLGTTATATPSVNPCTTYTTTDSGVTILNAQKAYDPGTTSTTIQSPIRHIVYDSNTALFYGYYRGNAYKKIYSSSDGLTWTLLFDFTTLVLATSSTTNYYTVQGGLHIANFNNAQLYVSTNSTGNEFILSDPGFTSGITYVAYDATRSLWVVVNSVSATTIYTTTDFITFTSITNLPGAGTRHGIVVTAAGRWIIATSATNRITYTDNAATTAWTSPTTGLPTITSIPYLQIVNGLVLWSNGDASLTLYSSADSGATFVAVAAPPTRQTPEVAWDGTNYAVTLNGQASLALLATSPDLLATSTWTTRSVTSPIQTAGGNGGAGASPGGGGGGGGPAISGTVGGSALTAASGGKGGAGLVRVYAW